MIRHDRIGARCRFAPGESGRVCALRANCAAHEILPLINGPTRANRPLARRLRPTESPQVRVLKAIPTIYPQTIRHYPAHSGTAARMNLLVLTSQYAGSRVWRGLRSRVAQEATELLVSGWSAVRIRSPALSLLDVLKRDLADLGVPFAWCAQRLSSSCLRRLHSREGFPERTAADTA